LTHDFPGSDKLDGKSRDIKKITQSQKKLDIDGGAATQSNVNINIDSQDNSNGNSNGNDRDKTVSRFKDDTS